MTTADSLSPAEREAVDRFCQALGLALRRIMGQPPVSDPGDLPQPVCDTATPAALPISQPIGA